MSSTGRGVERLEQDFYATPPWCAQRLLEACPVPPGVLYEPFAGDGAIIEAASMLLPAASYTWKASELREEAREPLVRLVGQDNVCIGDALDEEHFTDAGEFDGILTNPPFSLAFECLMLSMMRARFVAFLLRLNFLGSEERADFWRQYPPDVYILPNRPCFHVFFKDVYSCTCRKKNTFSVEEGSPPPICSGCGTVGVFKGKQKTTSDSTEYAWIVYPAGVRERKAGSCRVLATTPLSVRRDAIEKLLARQGRVP